MKGSIIDMDSDGHRGKMISRKNLVGVLSSVVFVCLLFLGILLSCNGEGFATSTSLRHVVALETGKRYVPVNPDPVYASKRRVPSGPDPIHNRHVGETRRPPGRA